MSLCPIKSLFAGFLTITIAMSGWGAGSNAEAARVIDLSKASSPGVIRLSEIGPDYKTGSNENGITRALAGKHRRIRQKIRHRIAPGQDPFRRTRTVYMMRPGGLAPPQLCSFSWHEANGHGYRKITCKRGYRAKFPAHRIWDYRLFRKTARWDQSRVWQGRFHPHNLYQGDLKNTDHGGLIQGNPRQYLDRPGRYRQSARFGQNIYFPRPLW